MRDDLLELHNKYLEKYPDQRDDILTLLRSEGPKSLGNLLEKALKKGKKIQIIDDPDKLDYVDVKLVDPEESRE